MKSLTWRPERFSNDKSYVVQRFRPPMSEERCIQKSHYVSIGSNDLLDEPLLRRAGQPAQVMQLSYLRVHMLCRRAKTVCLVYTSGLLGRARLVL